jgi:hypothetical protein
MEHRSDTAAGGRLLQRAVLSGTEATRDGNKTTINREDFTTEPLFHADPLFRMSRISTARRVSFAQVGRVI